MIRFFTYCVVCSFVWSVVSVTGGASAYAQSRIAISQMEQKLDRLSRDLQLLQREVYNTPAAAPSFEGSEATGGVAASQNSFQANLVVRMGELETQISQLRGQLEERAHAHAQLTKRLELLEKETALRLDDLETASRTSQTSAVMTEPSTEVSNGAKAAATTGAAVAVSAEKETKTQAPTAAVASKEAGVVPEFSSPREHYNHAFTLLQQEKYAAAAESFESFIATYHDDPLLGNVYYWLGETYYVRHEYKPAANEFRKGFQADTDGPKAPDNLLKLALSLEQLKKRKEACVVLNQLTQKYGEEDSAALKKARKAYDRMTCE